MRNGEFGRYTTLKEITSIDNTNNKQQPPPKTRTICISEDLYLHFVDFSQRYFNVEPYDVILENLLKCYEEHNQGKTWRDIELRVNQ